MQNEDGLKLVVDDAGDVLAAVISKIENRKIRIQSIDIEEPNLEAVFLYLT